MTTENIPELNEIDGKQALAERFASLPKPVQDAITSTDIEAEMRKLAVHHKLHFDQWDILEHAVLMTLLGVERTDDLEKNLTERLGVSADVAKILATDISRIVFAPVREHLEGNLGHPAAKAEQVSDVDALRTQILAQSPASAVNPSTPPSAPPTQKVTRAPISDSYHAGEPSSARASVDNDPYREPPV